MGHIGNTVVREQTVHPSLSLKTLAYIIGRAGLGLAIDGGS